MKQEREVPENRVTVLILSYILIGLSVRCIHTGKVTKLNILKDASMPLVTTVPKCTPETTTTSYYSQLEQMDGSRTAPGTPIKQK